MMGGARCRCPDINNGTNGKWFNVTISRGYKNNDGDFQDAESFSRDDLPQVAYAANKAFDHIINLYDEVEDDE